MNAIFRFSVMMGVSWVCAASLGCSAETADEESGASESAQTAASAASNKAVYSALAAVGATEGGKLEVRVSCSTSISRSQSTCTIRFISQRPTKTVNGSAKALYDILDKGSTYPSTTELWGARKVFDVKDIICSRSDVCYLYDRSAPAKTFTIIKSRANALRGVLSNLNVQYATDVMCSRTELRDEVPSTIDHECKFKQFDDDAESYTLTEGTAASAQAATIVKALEGAGIRSFPGGVLGGGPDFRVTEATVKCQRVDNKVTCARVAEGLR